MSDKIRAIKRDLGYADIIVDRLMRIEEYLSRATKDGYYLDDDYVLDNLAFQLFQAGEQLAQGKLSENTKSRYPNIPWDDIRKLRNFISHSYAQKRNAVLINVIENDVPKYIEMLSGVRGDLLHLLHEEQNKEG
ncbi:MAG: DUF86 domain-containing protein [Defluviitaleaceae bacterium]|nr:DUF86 domain-containing protein [Defluviitaleaceae bacterium]